jgi:putative spermidine/putrescine transport system substrate-binding protein
MARTDRAAAASPTAEAWGRMTGGTLLSRRRMLAGATTVSITPGTTASGGDVVVGTWGGDHGALLASSVDARILKPLGITVTRDLATQETRRLKLIAERNATRGSLDVACLSDIDAHGLSLLDLWEPPTPRDVPNLPRVLPSLRAPYAVPQICSGLVIVYNPDRVTPAPDAYADLWDPKFRNRIGFSDTLFAYNIAAAALAHGGGMSNLEPGEPALRDLKKLGARTFPDDGALAQAFHGDEIWLAPMWLARAIFWAKSGINVATIVPREGATPYVAMACVPKNAPDKANAFAYVNALLDPRAQADFATRLGYAPTVDNAAVSPELLRMVGFSAERQANFKPLDFDYLAKNGAALREYWFRDFKA